jgi:hypothetical protein
LFQTILNRKNGYQTSTNIVKDENGDQTTAYYSVLHTWRNHFPQLLKVGGVNDVMKIEIHKAELLVPELSAFESEIANEKIKITRIYLIPAEPIKAVHKTINFKVDELVNFICNKKKLQLKYSIITHVYKKNN